MTSLQFCCNTASRNCWVVASLHHYYFGFTASSNLCRAVVVYTSSNHCVYHHSVVTLRVVASSYRIVILPNHLELFYRRLDQSLCLPIVAWTNRFSLILSHLTPFCCCYNHRCRKVIIMETPRKSNQTYPCWTLLFTVLDLSALEKVEKFWRQATSTKDKRNLYKSLLAWWFVGGSSLVRENAFSLNSIK